MQVKEMMHKGAEYVAPNAKLQVIAKKMRDYDIGSIPVCDSGKLIGMVTDRDLAVRALANGKDVAKLEAKDVMSKDVIFCRDTEEAEDAIRIMEDNEIRRLPVLNEAKRLVGMVSLGDLTRLVARPYRRSDASRHRPSRLDQLAESQGAMSIPLQISFRNMDPSPAVEARIRKKAEKLERFHDRIVGCTVVIEAPHRHQHKGKLYSVRVDISVPGKDVVVDRAKPGDHAHEDVYVAIRDAFNAATRRLEDQARKMRGDVKTHAGRAPAAG